MSQIHVYDYEKADGLEEVIKTNTSLAYTLKCSKNTVEDRENVIVKTIANDKYGANPDQIDLYYFRAVLASIGWNNNDDIFIKEHTDKAIATAVDKPINILHQEKDIIGHTTSSFVLDFDGNLITGELPEKYDIAIGGVIYKSWEDDERIEKVSALLQEIEDGEQMISMEALFSNFDYACLVEDKIKVIARNKESSYLTKHLKAYGGSGQYQGVKIGRVLKDFTFSGLGFVGKKPANKRSVILNEKDSTIVESESTIATEITNKMTTENKETVDVAEFNTLKAQNADLVKVVASEKEQVENLKQLSAQKDEKISSLETEVKAATERAVAAENEVNSMKAEIVKAQRINKLVEVGVDKVRAEELVVKFSSANDEMFAEVVSLNTKTQAQPTKAEAVEKDKAEGNADVAALDKASAADKTVVTTPLVDRTKTVAIEVASWLEDNLKFAQKSE